MRQVRKHFGVRIILTALALLFLVPNLLEAQEPGFRSRIVDVVVLENKDRLFGILAPDPETRLLTSVTGCVPMHPNSSSLILKPASGMH